MKALLLTVAFAMGGDYSAHGDFLRQTSRYQTALKSSVLFNSPLVVGVKADPPAGPWIGVRIEQWGHWGGDGPFLILSRPVSGHSYWVRDLPAGTKSNEIERILAKTAK